MNFEKTYSSNLQNLFDNTGPGNTSYGTSRPQQSPKAVADFENRPILSYTIPTIDCTSPGLRSKPSFPTTTRYDQRQRNLSKSEAKVSDIGRQETESSFVDKRNKLSRLSCAPVVQTECLGAEHSDCRPKNSTPQSSRQSSLSRNHSLRVQKDYPEQKTTFVRSSSTRRSLQPGTDRERPQTGQTPSKSTRPSKSSIQVTKDDFISRIFSLKFRSKSTQRGGNEKVKEELLTDQTLPCITHEEPGEERSRTNACGSSGSGTDILKRSFISTSAYKGVNSSTVREGFVRPSSSSSSPSEPDRSTAFLNRTHPNSTPAQRRIFPLRPSSQSASRTSNYSNDDVNNNCGEDSTKARLFMRFGSLRIPKSSSSPFVKKRNCFVMDQCNEDSGENDFATGPSRPNSEYRAALENLNSANWQSRRDGLACLQAIIDQSPEMLNEADLKKITDSFTKMFHDPHSKVCSLFLEILPLFVSAYSVHLPHHWLNICMHKLFTKSGNELLGSMQVKIKKSLDVIRECFTCVHHLEVMTLLVNNQTLMHNSKSRESFLVHIKEFMLSVDPLDLCPSDELNELVTGLLRLLEKYQSNELKKNIQGILLTLFDLSPPTFSAVMYSQPRSVQDFMTRIAKHHVSSMALGTQVSSPSSSSSSLSFSSSGHQSQSRDNGDNVVDHHNDHQRQHLDSNQSSTNSSDSVGPSMRNVARSSSFRTRPSSTHQTRSSSIPDAPCSPSMNFPSRIPQRIEPSPYGNVKTSSRSFQVPTSPHQLSGSSSDVFVSPRIVRKVSLTRATLFSSSSFNGLESSGTVARQSCNRSSDDAARRGNDSADCTDEEYLAAEFDVFVEHFSTIDISNKTEWKQALKQLIHQLPSQPDLINDLHLTSLLSVLLSAPEDIDECSLIVAECLTTLLKTRKIDRSLLVLKNIVDRSDESNVLQALRWIKFQLEGVAASDVRPIVGDLVASVAKASDDSNKSVRMVSLMVLVQIYKLIGDEIWTHLQDINQHKKSLLQMYFRKPGK